MSEIQLLTVREVAKVMNFSPSFVYKKIKEGQIPCIQIGRYMRVNPQDLEAFLQANRTSSFFE